MKSNKVLMTQDYNTFKFMGINRQINENHVKNLIKSIKQNNLLHLRPITVDTNMQIVDGQHRLKAAEELQLPIYYTIEEDLDDQTVVLLNCTQKNWSIDDYLKFWINKGVRDYILLQNFIQKNNLSLSQGIETFSTTLQRSEMLNKFRKGEFKFTENPLVLRLFTQCMEIIEFIKQKIPFRECKYANSRTFFRALRSFLAHPEIDYDHFKSRLELQMKTIRTTNTISDYLEQFQNIYNYKSSQKGRINIL